MMLRHLGLYDQATLIENALLYTLEQGIHTGDFGKPGTASCGTTEFADHIIQNLGRKPSVSPVSASAESTKAFHPPARPTGHAIILGNKRGTEEITGADFLWKANNNPAFWLMPSGAACLKVIGW